MPRRAPADRLEKLIATAAGVFVEHRFHRAQMDDVAAALGVSKGTIYRSVASKEALFAAVLDYADHPDSLPTDGPLHSDTLEDVSARLGSALSEAAAGLALTQAVHGNGRTFDDSKALGDEVERLALDLYKMMAAHQVRIMVLDRCAAELPELAGDWYEAGRYVIVDLWAAFLARHLVHSTSSDHDVLARTIVELVTLWAVKIPWDPAPRPYPEDRAQRCAVMIRNLVIGGTV
jgi:AcrR family transcriptional regulator